MTTLCLIVLMLTASIASADPPATINIRGQLLDAQGHALSGMRDFSVQFYDAESGGNSLDAPSIGAIAVSPEGLFNIQITLPPAALAAPAVWYEVSIASGATPGPLAASDTFPNRVKVHSVPFALESARTKHVETANVGAGTVNDAEFGALAGVTGGIQGQLNAKADAADVYTQTEVNTSQSAQDTTIAAKANSADVYTKAQVDTSQSAQNTAITAKANASDLTTETTARTNADILKVAKAGDTMTGALNVNGSYIGVGQATAPGTVTDRLYNVGGTLQWNGSPAYRFPWTTVTTNTQMAGNNGYIANAASMLTLTLPASASLNVGDTLRVTGMGTGGWKIAQSDSQRILVDQMKIVAGSSSWKPRGNLLFWNNISCSADGTRLTACAYSDYIYTSSDGGQTWIARDSARGWKASAMSADGTKIVACTYYNGNIFTSSDSGATWTMRTTPAVQYWFGVASSSDGTKLAAAPYGNNVFTSADSGVTWTARESNRQWRCIASSSDGTKLLAGVNGGYLYTSSDSGVTWVPRMTDTNREWFGVTSSADGTKLVACAHSGNIYISTDSGATWTPRSIVNNWYSVASSSDGTKLIACATGGQIYVSSDSGLTWTAQESARDWCSVASSADGKRLMACPYAYPNDRLYIFNDLFDATTTGVTGYVIGGKNATIELQYFGSDTFVPISYVGSLGAN
jgi:hypothetical protein